MALRAPVRRWWLAGDGEGQLNERFEVFRNSWPGTFGGNMDVQEVAIGATVYLPVYVPEALLHIGDVHAMQGDGEINCGGGIECRSEVRLKVDLLPRPERGHRGVRGLRLRGRPPPR